MADNGFITNRRHLLIAMSASALVPHGFLATDSALLAYSRIMDIERALSDIVADEEDPHYLSWVQKLDQAENQLVQSRALCPEAVRAKLNRLACHSAWEPEQAIRNSPLARSIVSDFAALIAHLTSGRLQRLHAGQGLALHPFEESAAGG